MTVQEAGMALAYIESNTCRYSNWVMALAVGLACAAFGRLLGVDWVGTFPVFTGATIGQLLRRFLLSKHVNVFLCASVVSFISALLSGSGAQLSGSVKVDVAMIAAILLLVPGVPSINAQTDILEGHPTLGSARAVTVIVLLIFVAVGLWFSQVVLSQLT